MAMIVDGVVHGGEPVQPAPFAIVRRTGCIDLTGMSSSTSRVAGVQADSVGDLAPPIDGKKSCPHPLSVANCTNLMKTTSISKATEYFSKMSTRVGMAKSKRDDIIVPTIPAWHPHPEGQENFRDRVCRRMEVFIKDCIRPLTVAAICYALLCLRFTVSQLLEHDGETRSSKVWWVVASCGNDNAGVIRFRVMFVLCDVLGDKLTMQRYPHCETRHGLPFGGDVTSGVVKHMLHSDLSSMLLEPHDDGWLPIEVEIDHILVNPPHNWC